MDDVSKVREATDIVSLIGGYITLKKMGANFKAPCPFHNEKTPSFVVSPERQIWHCFGCHKGGDVFTFVMEYEHVEFGEALRMLAEKAGITLSKNVDVRATSQKDKLYTINKLASEYYHFLLTKHKIGEKARAYLEKRGIGEKLWETFQIGYAPKGANLTEYLTKKKNVILKDLLDAGLTSQGRSAHDFFQNRLIFTLSDHRNNVVGFSGRAIDTDFFGGKYINTKETEVYHKGETCFGLNITKDEIKKKNQVIVMEGEFDVMSSFKEGVGNVIALKGTAFTRSQVKLLKRFCTKVTMCLDTDSAGKDALMRSIPLLEEEGFTISAVVLPQGKDPDELIKDDPIAYKQAIEHDQPIYDVLLQQIVDKEDVGTIEGKKAIADNMLTFLSGVQNEVVREHYLKLLSRTVDTSQEALLRQMEKIAKERVINSLPKAEAVPVVKKTREEIVEDYFLSLSVQLGNPQEVLVKHIDTINSIIWPTPATQKILQLLIKTSGYKAGDFAKSLPAELVDVFDRAYLAPLPTFRTQKEWIEEIDHSLKELDISSLRSKIRGTSAKLLLAEKQQEEAAVVLREELTQLLAKLSRIEREGRV